MARNSGIEWTDHTWNPWRGCRKVSAGCRNCYMFREQKRYGRDPSTVVRAARQTFTAPLRWSEPARVFTCSWSDFFIQDADPWRAEAWDIIRRTPHLTYQILTKRPQNIPARLPHDWGDGWPNVWLGVSAENNLVVTDRLNALASIPAVVRFVSAEPLLSPVRLSPWLDRIHWVIAGGENGPGARAPEPNWFRYLRNQCRDADVPFFFKQWGGTKRLNGTWGGRILDGRTWDEMPDR